MIKVIYTIIIILTILFIPLNSTTWLLEDVECSICKTNNKFGQIMSWGPYIYNWDSKYQYIFWPVTESFSLYSCKNCNFTCFMWDYLEPDSSKHDEIKNIFATIKSAIIKDSYLDIPMIERLNWAKMYYTYLEMDNYFWCEYYRILGYYYEEESNLIEAANARKKALEIVNFEINNNNEDILKELYIIKSSMHYFLNEPDSALNCLKSSKKYIYKNPSLDCNENDNKNLYLNNLAEDFVKKIIDSQKIIE